MLNIPLTQASQIAKKIAKSLKGGEVLALTGDLGSGKTTFTKALGDALSIKQTITSPTFVIMQEYPIPLRTKSQKYKWLYHLDLYRLTKQSEIKSLGLDQIWTKPETITVIEWADKISNLLPKDSQLINFYRDLE